MPSGTIRPAAPYDDRDLFEWRRLEQLEYFMGLDFNEAWHKEWKIMTKKFIMREPNDKIQKENYEAKPFQTIS